MLLNKNNYRKHQNNFSVESQGLSRPIVLLYGLILILSLLVLLVNYFVHHFIGNNYFPNDVEVAVLITLLSYKGINLCFTKKSKPSFMIRELLYLLAVIALVALATNAVQFTPFPIIDEQLIALDKKFHIDMVTLLTWTNHHPSYKHMLVLIYNSLTYQMLIIPLILIVTCRFHLLREYYFLLLSSVLLGFSIYYFFPTTAPASILDKSLFYPEQIATGLKYNEIHHHMIPSTINGGLISFPSFHAIWALLCINLMREWVVPCIMLACINILLIFSCVSLGWHYSVDILGSFFVLLVSYYLLNSVHNKK